MNLEKLLEIQDNRKKKEIELYKAVLNNVEQLIEYYGLNNKIACVFQVPSFMYGHPPINVEKTTEYIIGTLNHRGFIAIEIQPSIIYITWELTHALKKESLKKVQKEKHETTNLKQQIDEDLSTTLFNAKFKR